MVKAGGTNRFDDLGDDGRIILKCMLKEYGGRVWSWLRIEARLVLIFGVHVPRENLASRRVFYCMQFVAWHNKSSRSPKQIPIYVS